MVNKLIEESNQPWSIGMVYIGYIGYMHTMRNPTILVKLSKVL